MSQPAESRPPERPLPAPSAPAERVGIAGSGTVACGLAACVASHGGEVLLWARSDESAQRAGRRIAGACEKLERTDAPQRVKITRELSGLSEATLAVEAVAERRSLKNEVLESLSAGLARSSIVATTTSSLSVSELAEGCGRPSRFFGLHVFNPVHQMQLVELCFPPDADRDTRARAAAFCESIGKTAVEVPDETGFVVNRLLFPYLFDAVRLLERTGMAPSEVDTCMKLGAAHPMGPLELLDLVGLDVAEAIGEAISVQSGDPAHRAPERIRQLVREGRLGRKSGAGFYRYGPA
jgi:3-hydroxybutyryl-CoA dehydrogenase